LKRALRESSRCGNAIEVIMMWKRILLAVIGAGMLGATSAESNASAAECPTQCAGLPTLECRCYEQGRNITTLGFTPITAVDINGDSSTIAGRRQRITGGTALQRRSMDYEMAAVGSTHHTGRASLSCVGGGFLEVGNLSTDDGTLSCPAGTSYGVGRVAIDMTTTVCPTGYIDCLGD
jgi:hypothetical protein